jgi:hypothetical protein
MCDKQPMLYVPLDGPAVEIPAEADIASMLDASNEQRVGSSRSSSRPAERTESWSATRKSADSPFEATA